MKRPRHSAYVTLLRAAVWTIVLAAAVACTPYAPRRDRPEPAATRPVERAARALSPKEIQQGYREGVVIAKPRLSPRESQYGQLIRLEAQERQMGLLLLRSFPRFGGLRVLQVPGGSSVPATVRALSALSTRYEFVEPDYIVSVKTEDFRHIPCDDDPRWALDLISAPTHIDAAARPVIVAVIDSGLNVRHAGIQESLWQNPMPDPDILDHHGINAVGFTLGGRLSADVSDESGHGTMVAGVVAARPSGNSLLAGVARNARIMPLKYLDANNHGTAGDAVACIDYAIAHGAEIINISFENELDDDGSRDPCGQRLPRSQLVAFAAARDSNIVVVAAAGTGGREIDEAPNYPQCLPLDNIVVVGSSTRDDNWSNMSPKGGMVDLFAPGVDVCLLDARSVDGSTMGRGSSFAAPHVTGALALLKATESGASYRELINRLHNTVDPQIALEGYSLTGGRLNVGRALSERYARPFNDDFDRAAVFFGERVIRVRASNACATAEPDETPHAGHAARHSIWFAWRPTIEQPMLVDVSMSDYEATVAIYTAVHPNSPTVDQLRVVPTTHHQKGVVRFVPIPKTIHYIAVDAKHGRSGMTMLRIITRHQFSPEFPE